MWSHFFETHPVVVGVTGVLTGAATAAVAEASKWDIHHVGAVAGGVVSLLALILPKLSKLVTELQEQKEAAAQAHKDQKSTVVQALQERQRIQERETQANQESMAKLLGEVRHVATQLNLRHDVSDQVQELSTTLNQFMGEVRKAQKDARDDFGGFSKRIGLEFADFRRTQEEHGKRLTVLETAVLEKVEKKEPS